MGLTLADLEARLWAAANALRGPVDPANFKTYVFPILFWKWISDSWTWEHQKAVMDFGAKLTPEVEADYHKFELRVRKMRCCPPELVCKQKVLGRAPISASRVSRLWNPGFECFTSMSRAKRSLGSATPRA